MSGGKHVGSESGTPRLGHVLVDEINIEIDRIVDSAKDVAIEKVAQRYGMDPDDLEDTYDELVELERDEEN